MPTITIEETARRTERTRKKGIFSRIRDYIRGEIPEELMPEASALMPIEQVREELQRMNIDTGPLVEVVMKEVHAAEARKEQEHQNTTAG